MKRRNILAMLGMAAGGGAVVSGTGAFTSVSADRSVSVRVADDADALLRLAPCKNSPNGAYVDNSDGQLSIDLTEANGNDPPAGSGVNQRALSVFDNVFEIANQGTQDVCVDFEVPVPEIPEAADVPERFDFDAGDPAVVFYRGDDRERFVISNRLNPDRDGAVRLPIDHGDAECIGIEVRAFGFDAGEDLFDGVDLTIRAEADSDCRLGAADLNPGSDYFTEGAYRLRSVDIDTGEDVSSQDDITADLDLSPAGVLDFDLGTDGNRNAGLELTYGATGVNLDGIDTIEVDVDFDADDEGDGFQSNFYVGVDENRTDVSRSAIRNDEVERFARIGADAEKKREFDGTLTLDVGGLSGRRDIGVGAQISTDFSEELSATVNRVAFLDGDGVTAFSLRLNSSLAPGFTSEGEYRSVARDMDPPPRDLGDKDDFTADLTADGELEFDLRVGTPADVNAALEKSYGATDVNVDSLDTVEVSVDFDADDKGDGLQANFYVGVDEDREDVSRNTVRSGEVERAAVLGADGDGEDEFAGTLVLDISELSGRRDIGIGTQISTNGEEKLSATVDRVAFRREVATEFSLGLDGGSE